MAIVNTFSLESNKKNKINFNGGDLSSDGGILLIKEFAAQVGLTKLVKQIFKTNDPAEEIPLYYSYQDDQRQCMVYFPSYYPNGDYYFFGDAEWKYGLFGHPWLNEIIVSGEELIRLFEENSQALGITAKKQ